MILRRLREFTFVIRWYVRYGSWRRRRTLEPGALVHPNRPEAMLRRATIRAEERSNAALPETFRITAQNVLAYCTYDHPNDSVGGPKHPLAALYEDYAPSHRLSAEEMWRSLAAHLLARGQEIIETFDESTDKSLGLGAPIRWRATFKLLSHGEIECVFQKPRAPYTLRDTFTSRGPRPPEN